MNKIKDIGFLDGFLKKKNAPQLRGMRQAPGRVGEQLMSKIVPRIKSCYEGLTCFAGM